MSARSPGVKRGRQHPDAVVAVRGFEHPAAGCWDGLYSSFSKVSPIHYTVRWTKFLFGPYHQILGEVGGGGGGDLHIFLLLSFIVFRD